MKILKSRLYLIFPYLLVGLYFCLSWFDIATYYKMNYALLLLSYFLLGGIVVLVDMNKRVSLFDPFVIISFLYLNMFLIYPLYDYSRLNLLKAGVDTTAGCAKGTLIFVLAFLSFFVGYMLTPLSKKKITFFQNLESLSPKLILWVTCLVWLVAFLGSIYALVAKGFSLNYLLSFGTINIYEPAVSIENSKFLFLLMLGPTLVVSWLLIMVYSRTWMVRILFTLPTVSYLFMRNGRWIAFVALLAPTVYYYLKKHKTPSLTKIVTCGTICLFVFSMMQVTRGSLYSQKNIMAVVEDNILSLDTYMQTFESDFSTYKTYYGIVQSFPRYHSFLLGKGIFAYTVTLIIPRALWKNKPDAPEHEVVRIALNEQAVMGGVAYPNIGAFYVEFGIIGCIAFMLLFGFLMSRARILYMQNSKIALVLYACLYPFCFQLVARSPSSAVYLILFALIPVFVLYGCYLMLPFRRRKYESSAI